MEDIQIKRFLLNFRKGELVAEFNIRDGKHKATQEEIQEIVELGFIKHVGETSLGAKQYMITDLGRQFRKS